MLDFTVNVVNESQSDSITVSPLDAWGFGCCVPPRGQMNFSFKSNGSSDSITLALVLLSDQFSGPPQIAGIQSNGGTYSVKTDQSKPCLVEITNFRSQSVTHLTIGDQKSGLDN
ncbi:MAG: hypothetical protein GY940_33800 [bacterium]|nr:hypothetical protein [bacterium]